MIKNFYEMSLPEVEDDHDEEVESLLHKSGLVQNFPPLFGCSVFLWENWLKIKVIVRKNGTKSVQQYFYKIEILILK